MTAIIISVYFKKLIKIGDFFCVAILVLKMEENREHFLHTMLYYFKRGKSTSEVQNKDLWSVRRSYSD